MNTKRMTCRAYIKSVNEADRTVEQIVSVFNNVDFAKDRVREGAFAATLERWATSGDPIPAIWSHTWEDPFAHIGAVLEAKELAPGDPLLPDEISELGGLYTKYQVDDRPFADQVFHLLKERRVREASFAYDVIRERKGPDGINDLLELDLIEIGPTLKGMNPMTQLLSAKSLHDAATAAGITDGQFEKALLELWPNLTGEGPDRKAWVTVDGAVETVQEQVFEAAYEWARGENIGDGGFYYCYLEATFPTETPVRAIVLVEGWSDPVGEGEFYELRFVANEDGDGLVVDGDPTAVSIQGVVSPKARRKALRRIAGGDGPPPKAMPSGTVEPNDDVKSKGKAEDPTGNAEDPEARNESVTTGEAARALVELEALSLTD